ncbi:glycosyltransferase family 4 protein [Curvibacter sp. HBC28]|uniref:Glycosyltransferase family 4 protein n=1 Tax=Curvibacter microcysteis TaxID=3026419 RepID=A0ABT5MHJ5_9BURK|nr:glycosyltransferase family 4 protein [Curvibacter sp. HBC28]MDD0814591.1 glycosyltransferase family 4 protein [Curvibacter sp. HBC28]
MTKILITSPSLEVNKNVSGIAALVRPLVSTRPTTFFHLNVGTPDSAKSIGSRIFYATVSMSKLLRFRFSSGRKIFHLNTSADTPAVVRDFLLFLIAKLLFLKVVVHYHGGKWLTTTPVPFFIRKMIYFMINYSARCIVLGPQESQHIKKTFSRRPLIELPNFVGEDYFQSTKAVNLEIGGVNIIFLGRFVESKSVDIIPDLWSKIISRYPGSHLFLCGDGPLRLSVLSHLEELSTGGWTYCGVVQGQEKIALLRNADIFILPSRSGEGMPIAMLEAMASRLIPVVTDLGAISSVVNDAVNGFIARPGDVDDFFACMLRAYESMTSYPDISDHAFVTANDYRFDLYLDRLELIYGSI